MTDSPNTVQSWLAHLSLRRIITSNRFIPEVDGFRFIAILIVIVSHVYVQCGPVPGTGAFAQAFAFAFEDGKRGVYLFFTIADLSWLCHSPATTCRKGIGSTF